ncbi:MAG: polyprenyl synthetase family protein [Candidatus Aenigmarchaeota archaeon]|nr:polyprenyl synthetase family protein [Candidatus Aenigmarchaeota archaeon]
MDIEKTLLELKPKVDARIEKYIARSASKSYAEFVGGKASFSHDLGAIENAILKPIWNLLDRGGKRWRPALFLFVVEALGKNPDNYLDFAVIPEVVHNGTLMVDDIEDSAELRRGKPCTHKLFGEDVAINAGNAMYYLPLKALSEHKELDNVLLACAYRIYTEEMINLSIGQAMDIWWHKGNTEGLNEDKYLQMCAYKTGTLARMAARMAAVFAGGTKEQEMALGILAERIGVGFQIQDDVLDIALKDRKAFGKSFGNDIKEGKRTLMVVHAMQNAPKEDANRLKEILGMHTSDKKLAEEAIAILEKAGSTEYAKKRANELVENAWNDAADVLPEGSGKEKLHALVEFLLERKR